MQLKNLIFIIYILPSLITHGITPKCNHQFFKYVQTIIQTNQKILDATLKDSQPCDCSLKICPYQLTKTTDWLIHEYSQKTSHRDLWNRYASVKALNTKYSHKNNNLWTKWLKTSQRIQDLLTQMIDSHAKQKFCEQQQKLKLQELLLQHLPTIATRMMIGIYFDWLKSTDIIVKKYKNNRLFTLKPNHHCPIILCDF